MEWTVTLAFPQDEGTTTTGAGETVTVKSLGTGCTTIVTAIDRVIAGRIEVPVIVRLKLPIGVSVVVCIIRVVLSEAPWGGVSVDCEKPAAEFDGAPVTCSVIGALKLPSDITVTEYVAACPCETV
jgi:hypothetical protein